MLRWLFPTEKRSREKNTAVVTKQKHMDKPQSFIKFDREIYLDSVLKNGCLKYFIDAKHQCLQN